MGNNELVRQRAGQVQLSTDLFTTEQQAVFEKLIVIADRNPVIKWEKGQDHNLDFCLIEGRIEPVKNFHMKSLYTAGLSYANKSYQIVGTGREMACIATVRVWKEGDDRTVEEIGGATLVECWGKNGKRAFHDMVARAQTRALKKAVEAYMGFAFVNIIIKEIFGGYEVEGDRPEDAGLKMKDVTESAEKDQDVRETMTAAVRQIAGNIFRTLEGAYKRQLISSAEMNETWERVKNFYHDENELLREQRNIAGWLKEKGA